MSSKTTQPACSSAAPRAGGEHAVDRLRPEDAAQRNDRRRRRAWRAPARASRGRTPGTPASRRRGMRLDAAAGEVDQQRRREHLADGDGVAGDGRPGRMRASAIGNALIAPPRKTAAQTWMWMLLVGPAHVARRDPEGDAMPKIHCDRHQHGEQAVGLVEDAAAAARRRSPRSGGVDVSASDVVITWPCTARRCPLRCVARGSSRRPALCRGELAPPLSSASERVAAGVVARMPARDRDAAAERSRPSAS